MTSYPDRLQQKLARLQKEMPVSGLLCQGTVLAVKKPRQDPKNPRLVYQWTRKVQKKTLTVTLGKAQYAAFKAAIANQRRLLETIRQMQELSVAILLSADEQPPKNHPKRA